MKKLLTILCLILFANIGFSQTLTDTVGFQGILVPKYMGSGSSTRTPVIFRAKVINLNPNTKYRFYTNMSVGTDLGTTNSGAGNPLFIASTNWRYTSSVSTTNPAGYDEFTTDNSGEYEGWFGVANTGNSRFTAGNYVKPTIVIIDTSGTKIKNWAMHDSIAVLSYATTSGANNGSGLYGYSIAPAQEIVAVYEKMTDTRPSSVTFVDGGVSIGGSAFASLAKFYTDSVRTKAGAWGTIIRNDNADGIQKIERWSFITGNKAATYTDADGVWPSSVDTRNATAGVNGLLITQGDAELKAPTIDVNTTGFTNDLGLTYPNTPSSGSNFIFSGLDLADTLFISTKAPFEMRVGVNSYSSNTIKLVPTGGLINTTVLDVRFTPTTTGIFEDTIYFMSAGAPTKMVLVKGTASNNPQISFQTTSFNVNEGVGSVTLQVNISNANNNSTSVDLVTLTPGTATAGSDYTFTSPQTLTFPANSNDSIVVIIPIINDNVPEGTENIWFGLTNATNGAVYGANDSVKITITDNDYRKVNIGSIATVDANGVSDSLFGLYEVTGVVYGINLRSPGFQFTIRDQTGGLGTFGPANAFGYTPTEGDSITIRGRLSQFNGLAQLDFIDTIIFYQSNRLLKTPTVVTKLGENTESDLVRFDNCTAKTNTWVSGNQYVYINGGTDSVYVRIAPNSNVLVGKSLPTGTFSLVGIGGQFDGSSPYTSGYQLFPRGLNDVIEIKDSLSNFNLLTPATNTSITIQGAGTQLLNISWEASLPLQGLLPASYEFLLDIPTGNFSSPILSVPSSTGGSSTSLGLPYTQVATFLASQGVNVGQSISLIWTVRATTTNNYSKLANQAFNITFTRDAMNSVKVVLGDKLSVYPNPAANTVFVEAPENITKVTITTLDGKTQAMQVVGGVNKTEINTTNFINGMYIVSVETANAVYTHRLVIQK